MQMVKHDRWYRTRVVVSNQGDEEDNGSRIHNHVRNVGTWRQGRTKLRELVQQHVLVIEAARRGATEGTRGRDRREENIKRS